LNEKKAQPSLNASFDKAVILFNQIVEILALSQFTGNGKPSCCFQFVKGFGIGCVFIDRNHARSHRVGGAKGFREKLFGGEG